MAHHRTDRAIFESTWATQPSAGRPLRPRGRPDLFPRSNGSHSACVGAGGPLAVGPPLCVLRSFQTSQTNPPSFLVLVRTRRPSIADYLFFPQIKSKTKSKPKTGYDISQISPNFSLPLRIPTQSERETLLVVYASSLLLDAAAVVVFTSFVWIPRRPSPWASRLSSACRSCGSCLPAMDRASENRRLAAVGKPVPGIGGGSAAGGAGCSWFGFCPRLLIC